MPVKGLLDSLQRRAEDNDDDDDEMQSASRAVRQFKVIRRNCPKLYRSGIATWIRVYCCWGHGNFTFVAQRVTGIRHFTNTTLLRGWWIKQQRRKIRMIMTTIFITFVDKCSVAFTDFSAPTNVTCTSLFFLVRFWNQVKFILFGSTIGHK